MLDIVWAAFSLLLVAGGVVGMYEYRAYTPEQRSRAPTLSKAFLAAVALMGVVGLWGLAWAVVYGFHSWAAMTLAGTVALPVTLVQWRMHRKMGVDRSPLFERFG